MESTKVFGIPHIGEICRKTVVGLIFNPSSSRFLYSYWPDYKLCCLISGGVEIGETHIDALKREINEETGYKDFKIINKLQGTIFTHYYMAEKNEYRSKEIESYLVILCGDNKDEVHLEADEKFIIKEATYNELLILMGSYKNSNGGGLEDHLEILKRGKEALEEQGFMISF